MSNKDGWMWIPTLAFGIGGAIPRLLADFSDDSWMEGIWLGMFSTSAVFTWGAFKRIGKWMPRMSKWMLNSFWGSTLLAFVGTFVASGIGVLFALLPLPHWLVFVVGIFLGFVALMTLISNTK